MGVGIPSEATLPRRVRRKLAERRYVALDTETTGFNAEKGANPVNYPTQFAAVAYDPADGSIVTLISAVVSGAKSFDEWAVKNTHVTLEETRSGRTIADVLQEFRLLLREDDVIVMHNKEYDWDKVLSKHAPQSMSVFAGYKLCCTQQGNLAKHLFKTPGQRSFKWPKLEELCKALGVTYDTASAHGAEYDAAVLAQSVKVALCRKMKL